jgi:hypothetical protein
VLKLYSWTKWFCPKTEKTEDQMKQTIQNLSFKVGSTKRDGKTYKDQFRSFDSKIARKANKAFKQRRQSLHFADMEIA